MNSNKPDVKRMIGTLENADGPYTREAVELEGTVTWATPRALLVEIHTGTWGEKLWVPRSQICAESEITPDSDVDDEGTLVIPEWLWAKAEPVTDRRS